MKKPETYLAPAEVTYLAALLDIDSLIGVPDPFVGWLADEVRAAMERAQADLAARGIICLDPDGTIGVDADTAALIRACGHARRSFMLTLVPAAGRSAVHCFHAADDAAVHLETDAARGCRLESLDGPGAIADAMLNLSGLYPREVTPGLDGGAVPEEALVRARSLAAEAGAEAAQAALQEAGLGPAAAQLLAGALAEPLVNGTVMCVTPGASVWNTDALGFFESELGLWLLRPLVRGGQKWVDIIPCCTAHLGSALSAFVAERGGAACGSSSIPTH